MAMFEAVGDAFVVDLLQGRMKRCVAPIRSMSMSVLLGIGLSARWMAPKASRIIVTVA